ncbi:MAG: VWA domain-containing protein, partial [Desulfobacterales bacterium]|nr:VWA domain-containing protein [Desulfobacterales bacterium]
MPAGGEDRSLLLDHVRGVNPKGKTPIADAVGMVVETLKSRENETTIVLVSDGEETCNAAPCEAIAALKASGVKFILH